MVALKVAVTVTVRAMIVSDSTVIAIPVAFIEERSIMMGRHPVCADVRRTGPVSVVPPIMMGHRVPVAPNIGIADAGTSRLNPNYTRARRRADSHSNENLTEDSSRCQQHQDKQFTFHGFDSSSS